MRVAYDPIVDMAYISLVEIGIGGVAETKALALDVEAGQRLINLDFDRDGRLLGIEIDGARATLPPELLSTSS